MSMKTYETLEDMLCMELDEIVGKGELSAGSLDTVDKITHTIKNIHKIMDHEMEMGGSYAMSGRSYGGSYRSYAEQEPGRERPNYRESMMREDPYTGYSGRRMR